MRLGWKAAAVTVVVFSLSACDGGTDPTPQNFNMVVDFCTSEIPEFLAVQNDGGAWTRVQGDTEGSFSFDAADKLIVAFVRRIGSDFDTEVVFTTKAEMQPLNGVACKEDIGTKTLNGTVANIPVGSGAQISVGSSSDFSTGSAFTLFDVAQGNVDFVASREAFNSTSSIPNRVIVRRAQNYTSTIPVLDFAASEAVAPATNTATLSGLSASETNFIQVYFVTSAATTHSLFFTEGFTSTLQTIFGVPSAQTGDFHALTLFAGPSDFSAARAVATYYQNSGDKTLSLGAALNTPSVTTAATTPYARLRGTLAKQDDYNSTVAFSFTQTNGQFVTRDWTLLVTAGYFGVAPATWDVTMPDLTGISGFPNAGLQSGVITGVFVEASNARPALFFAPDITAPLEGEVQKFAYVTVTATAAVVPGIAGRPARRLRGPQSPFRARRF